METYSLTTVQEVVKVQQRLTELGYLDPPADGGWGPVSKWAMSNLCADNKLVWASSEAETFSDDVQAVLNNSKPLPLNPSPTTLAGKIIGALVAKTYWVSRHPDTVNVVYVEGLNPDGTPNDNRPNWFNDVRCVIRIGLGGIPKLEGIWEATTEPSTYWTMHPMNPGGAFHIALGQQKAWVSGYYHTAEAWLQYAPITGYRDPGERQMRDYSHPVTGNFGVHHHHGYDLPRTNLANAAAGCQVGRTRVGHAEFMRLTKNDARRRTSPSYLMLSTVISSEDLSLAK
jgi:hypothetical protein